MKFKTPSPPVDTTLCRVVVVVGVVVVVCTKLYVYVKYIEKR